MAEIIAMDWTRSGARAAIESASSTHAERDQMGAGNAEPVHQFEQITRVGLEGIVGEPVGGGAEAGKIGDDTAITPGYLLHQTAQHIARTRTSMDQKYGQSGLAIEIRQSDISR
jgi:hypothetical protein